MQKFFDKFNQEFENQLSRHNRRDEAFNAAKEKFQQENGGFSPYKNNDSFKNVRSRKFKRSKSSD